MTAALRIGITGSDAASGAERSGGGSSRRAERGGSGDGALISRLALEFRLELHTMRNGRLMIVFTGGTGHLFNAHREAPGEPD